MTRQEKMLKAALAYRNKFGFSVIPSSKNKVPLLKRNKDGSGGWSEYQTRYPTEEEIKQWWGTDYPGANISLICGKLSNRIVVDIDTYKNPDAVKLIESATPDTLLMPIVDTPRGGEHRHFLYNEQVRCSGENDFFIDIKSEGGLALLPPSEFQGKSYAWRNGFSVKSIATPDLPLPLIDLFISLYKKGLNKTTIDNSIYTIEGADQNGLMSTRCPNDVHTPSISVHDCPQNIKIRDGQRDHKLFHLANFLIKSGMPANEVQEYLLLFARNCCEVPFTDREAITKVESAMKREYDKSKTLAEMVREYVEDADGYFLSTDVHKYTQVSTRKDMKNISEILRRLISDRVIERHGTKNGCFRKIRNDLGLRSIRDIGDAETLDIRLPFGFERYVDIMPKDIIAVAGAPNVGKTTIMIECTKLNMNRSKVFYWSTETGLENMRKRLNKGKELDPDNWVFEMSDEFDENYEDAIEHDPNAVHIFDYIEATDGEYYKIPSKMARIHARLKGGVSFVALQKREGGGTYGGQQTEAKPSVFFTIDRERGTNIMRVKKAKNFKDINPNGFCIDFKIVNGIKLLPQGIWEPEM